MEAHTITRPWLTKRQTKHFLLAKISNPLQVLVIFSFYRSMQLSFLAALHTFRSTIYGSRPSSSFHRFVSLSASLTFSLRAGNLSRKLSSGMAVQSNTTDGRSGRECHGWPKLASSVSNGEKPKSHTLLWCSFKTKSLLVVYFCGNHDEDEMNSRNVGTKRARCGEIINRRRARKRMCSDRDLIGGTSGIEENEKRAGWDLFAPLCYHRRVACFAAAAIDWIQKKI